MKTIKIIAFTVLMLMFSSSMLLAQSAKLEVEVSNIKDVKGSLRASLFTEKSTFLKVEYRGKVVKVVGPSMTIVFENLPEGDYALSVIHDENENGELDSNFMGIPKEGFGFGNNALGRFGPPDFEKTIVKLNRGVAKQAITLKYY